MEQVLLRVYFVVQKMLFSSLDKESFDSIIRQGKVLEKDNWGIKVVETTDNKIVKFFRLKRVYSSALFSPYAWRFKNNADQLKKLGIKTMDVENVSYCISQQRHVVTYKKIDGQSIREKIDNGDKNSDLIEQLIKFIAELHEKGVFFRSLHFGNIIIDSHGAMALIDISDLKIYKQSLSLRQRIRNWKHLLKYDFESNLIEWYGRERFFLYYIKLTILPNTQVNKLISNIYKD